MSLASGLPLKGSFLQKPCNLKCSLYSQGSKGVYETDVSHQLDPLNYNLLNKQDPITCLHWLSSLWLFLQIVYSPNFRFGQYIPRLLYLPSINNTSDTWVTTVMLACSLGTWSNPLSSSSLSWLRWLGPLTFQVGWHECPTDDLSISEGQNSTHRSC